MTQPAKPLTTPKPAPSAPRLSPIASRIRRGKLVAPLRVCVFGQPGVGKTTFAAHAPDPLFMCTEDGAEQLDVAKLDRPTSWEDAVGMLRQLSIEAHDFKSLVVDTLDALEPMAVTYVCQRGNKETLADFDWGKGRQALGDQWRLFIRGLEVLRKDRGMNIILLAHCHVKPTNDPQLGAYDRFTPKLDDRAWNMTNEWCDVVGFAQFETALYGKKGERTRGIVTGARVLRTVRDTGFEAKNRFSLPSSLPLDWGTFAGAIQAHQVAPVEILRDQLATMLAELGNAELGAKANAYVQEQACSAQAYAEAINTVQSYLNDRGAEPAAKGE